MTSLPIAEAISRLGISDKTIRNRIKAGSLPAHKERGRWLVEVPDAEQTAEHRAPIPRTAASLGEVAWADPLRHFIGGIPSYNPSILVTRKGLWVFKEISRDDQVKAALSFKKHAMLASGWEVVSPDEQNIEWEPRRFVEDQLNHMTGTFDEAMLDVMTGLDYGYSVTEKLYERIPAGEEWAGKIGLKALKAREPTSIQFDVDEFGNIADDGIIQQYRSDAPGKRLPRWKFILWQHQAEFGNPYGKSDLEAAYRPYWVKDQAFKWMAMMLERFGVPPTFGLYDPGAFTGPQIDDLKTVFERIQAATSALIPRGSDKDSLQLWTPELAGQVSSVFIPAFEMLDRHLARSILMPGMLSLTSDSGGSLARAKVAFDVFVLIVQFLQKALKERINEELVRDLVELNFPVDELPEFRFLPITEDTQLDLMKTWAEMLGIGAVLPAPEDEVHIRNVMKFPDRVPVEGEELGPPKPEAKDDDDTDDDDPDDEPDDDEPEDDGEDAEDEDEDEATNAMMREFAATRRPLTKVEKKAGLRGIQSKQDAIEEEARTALVAGFRRLTDRAIKRLGKEVTTETIDGFKITISKDLRKAYGDLLAQSFRAGRIQIRDQMRKANFEVNYVPREAVQFLETTERFWVKSLGDELTQDVRQELVQAVRGGHHHRETIQRVRGVMAPFTGDPAQLGDPKQASAARVETIVRTNGTTALNHGRLVEARRVGGGLVPSMAYSSVLDGNTTDVCRNLDGKIFPIDSPDLDRLAPPNHFRSFPSGTLVAAGSVAAKASREYEGQIVSIRTETGKLLTGTPNHPILTDRGWIALGALDERSRIVCRGGRDGAAIFETDDQDIPANIEDVAVTTWSAGGVHTRVMPTAAEDFHGDGAGSKICVVAADGLLWRRFYAARAKHLLEIIFASANVPTCRVALACQSTSQDDAFGVWLAPNGIMRSLGELLAAFWAELIHANQHGFAPGAQFDTGLAQALEYRDRGDAEVSGYLLRTNSILVSLHDLLGREIVATLAQLRASGLEDAVDRRRTDLQLIGYLMTGQAGAVQFEDVVNVEIDLAYHGTVHCLETGSGSYWANGIMTSNCRSILVPVTLDIEVDPKDMVTPADVGRAVDEAGKGFAGGAPPPPPAPVPPTPLPVKRKTKPAHMRLGKPKHGYGPLPTKPVMNQPDIEKAIPKSLAKMRKRYGDPFLYETDARSNYMPELRRISMDKQSGNNVMRHEWGHFVDSQMGKQGNLWWSEHATVNTAFLDDKARAIKKIGTGDKLLEDYKKLMPWDLNKKAAAYGPEFEDAVKIQTRDNKALLTAAMDSGDPALLAKASHRVPNKYLSQDTDLLTGDVPDSGFVEDFVEALTETKAGRGHGLEYYQKNPIRYRAEMFANATALHERPIHRALIERAAPTWHKMFKEAIEQ